MLVRSRFLNRVVRLWLIKLKFIFIILMLKVLYHTYRTNWVYLLLLYLISNTKILRPQCQCGLNTALWFSRFDLYTLSHCPATTQMPIALT